MLEDCWLVTDLDGTLVPTPHKAHGEYVPVSDAKVFPSLKTWLEEGGNICVITTADSRTVKQVYLPLRDTLEQIHISRQIANDEHQELEDDDDGGSDTQEEHDKGAKNSEPSGSYGVHQVSTRSAVSPAATHRWDSSVRSAVRRADAHIKQQEASQTLRDSTDPTASPKTKKTHWFPPCRSQLLLSTHGGAALHYVRPTISAQRAADMELIEVEGYTDICKTCISEGCSEAGCSILAECFYAFAETVLRAKDDGPIGGMSRRYQKIWHLLKPRLLSVGEPGEAQQHEAGRPPQAAGRASEKAVQRALNQLRNGDSVMRYIITCKKLRETSRAGRQGTDGKQRFVGSTLSPSSKHEPSQFGGGKATDCRSGIIQLLLVGVPMAFSMEYLKTRTSEFDRLGLRYLSQPNSVVVTCAATTKGTCVSYLTGTFRPGFQPCPAPFEGRMKLSRAVALGDTPQAGDKQLTLFPPMHFVSLQVHDYAISLGHLLFRKMAQRHMLYVGEEEVGGARFLQELISSLKRCSDAHQQAANNVKRGWAVAVQPSQVGSSKSIIPQRVEEAVFHQCIHEAARAAKQARLESDRSKL